MWHVLEKQRQFKLKLVNAQHYHGVDGQKTDQIDAAWLAELLQCGLLKGSFVPPQWQRELRDLTRLRVSLLQDQNRIQNRIEKVLEDANIKLGSVVSDTMGASGKRILRHWSPAIKVLGGWPNMLTGNCVLSARNWKRRSMAS